ncbi:MAG: MarR family transcriptional regulator [Oceanicaulis sp.]
MTEPSQPPRGGIDVDASVLFRMVRIVNMLTRTFPARSDEEMEITLLEWRVLAVVACHPRTTMTEIAHYTGYNRMNVSRALRSLEARGLLERIPDPGDRRRIVSQPTDEGLDFYARISGRAREMDALMLSSCDPGDLAAAGRVLDEILANLYRLIEGEEGGSDAEAAD